MDRFEKILASSFVSIFSLLMIYSISFYEIRETPTGNFILVWGYAGAVVGIGALSVILAFMLRQFFRIRNIRSKLIRRK